MLPNSVTLGEKSTSIAIVAALIKRIVTIGVRKTATCSSSATASSAGSRWAPRELTRHGIFCAHKRAKSLDARLGPKTFQIGLLGRAEHLDAFFREVIVETGKREPGTVNGRLANFPMKPDPLSFQLQMKLLPMRSIKTVNRDDRNVLALFAP